MADITLQQAQQMVDAWIKTYGVRYFNELTNMTILTEEVGELARIMARTYGEQSFKESDKHRDLGDEMADVLWVLLCLANQTGVDLTAAFEKNLQKKTDRDKERHINNQNYKHMAHHHDCECGHDHHHEHEHESNSVQIDRYHEAFNKFEPALPDTQTTETVNALLEKHFQENFTPEVLKTIHGCIDLTSLTSLDTKENIWKMVDTVNDFEGTRPDVPNVAAICVYPLFVETVKQALTAQEVKIASVAGGFPSSQTFTEVKIAETAMAVMQGADEIDVVMNLGYFMEDNFEELTEELQEIKESCRHAHLKVILETGALVTTENIQKASILAMYSGADFIKTSTGKGYPGATFEAAYTMCKAIKTYHSITGNKVGIKISGGVRTAEDAVRYYTIVKEILGDEWLNKDLFRIGASSLVGDIEKRLGK